MQTKLLKRIIIQWKMRSNISQLKGNIQFEWSFKKYNVKTCVLFRANFLSKEWIKKKSNDVIRGWNDRWCIIRFRKKTIFIFVSCSFYSIFFHRIPCFKSMNRTKPFNSVQVYDYQSKKYDVKNSILKRNWKFIRSREEYISRILLFFSFRAFVFF